MNLNPTLKDLKILVPVKPIIYKNVNKLSNIISADRRDLYFKATNSVTYGKLPEGPGELLKIVPPRQQYTNYKQSIIEDFRLVIPSHYDTFYVKHKKPLKDIYRQGLSETQNITMPQNIGFYGT